MIIFDNLPLSLDGSICSGLPKMCQDTALSTKRGNFVTRVSPISCYLYTDNTLLVFNSAHTMLNREK